MTWQIELARAKADIEIADKAAEQAKENRMARMESEIADMHKLLRAIRDALPSRET